MRFLSQHYFRGDYDVVTAWRTRNIIPLVAVFITDGSAAWILRTPLATWCDGGYRGNVWVIYKKHLYEYQWTVALLFPTMSSYLLSQRRP